MKYTCKETFQVIQEDSGNINRDFTKRMQKSDISNIMAMARPGISPAEYCLLQHGQFTIASEQKRKSIVRHFSVFRRLKRVDSVFVYHCTLAFEPNFFLEQCRT